MSEWLDKKLYGWKPLSHLATIRSKSSRQETPLSKTELFQDINKLIALNENVLLIKYDPDVLNSSNVKIASNLDFFYDYGVYEFPQSSMIRSYPLRVLYSYKVGKTITLNGTKGPILEMMRQLYYRNFKASEKIKESDQINSWVKLHLVDYFYFFFDNVNGPLGRFELVSTFDEIVNRIHSFYFHRSKVKKDASILDIKPLTVIERQFISLLKDYINKYEVILERHKSYYLLREQPIIFQNSIFHADILFYFTDDVFGQIEFKNEILLYMNDNKLCFQNTSTLDHDDDVNVIPLAITSYS